jgi:hypothetical protein
VDCDPSDVVTVLKRMIDLYDVPLAMETSTEHDQKGDLWLHRCK